MNPQTVPRWVACSRNDAQPHSYPPVLPALPSAQTWRPQVLFLLSRGPTLRAVSTASCTNRDLKAYRSRAGLQASSAPFVTHSILLMKTRTVLHVQLQNQIRCILPYRIPRPIMELRSCITAKYKQQEGYLGRKASTLSSQIHIWYGSRARVALLKSSQTFPHPLEKQVA